MEIFGRAVPNENFRPEANKVTAQALEVGAQRLQDKANFFEEYARRWGTLDGADTAWDAYMSQNPVFMLDDKGEFVVRRPRPQEYLPWVERLPVTEYTPERIRTMSLEEITAAPIEALSEEQVDAMIERLRELEAQDRGK